MRQHYLIDRGVKKKTEDGREGGWVGGGRGAWK